MTTTDDSARYKQQAGEAAAELVQDGMIVGLGHGSTAQWALRRLAERLTNGTLRNIIGVPCSEATARQARALRVPLRALEEVPHVDLTFDGADEVDPAFNLIKGGGGALLREKLVAQATRHQVIVADVGKQVMTLGAFPVPVEVVAYGHTHQRAYLERLGARATLRTDDDGQPYRTDSGHVIYDCAFGTIADVPALAAALKARTGVVEHGLFVGLVHRLIVAGPEGVVHSGPGG